MDITTLAAASINVEKLKTLTGGSQDVEDPNFIELNQQFVRIGEKAKRVHIKWIYAMLIKDGQLIFSFESLAPGDPDYEPPGYNSLYKEPPKELLQVVQDKRPRVADYYTDEYGTYVSAFFPIIDPQTGQILAVIGADMEYSQYIQEVRKVLIYPLTTVFFAIVIIYLIYAYIKRLRKSRQSIINSLDRIEREKAKMEVLLSVAGEPLIVCDKSGVINYLNTAAEESLGCHFAEIAGKPYLEAFSTEKDGIKTPIAQDSIDRLMAGKQKVTFTSLDTGVNLVCDINNRSIPVIANLSPIVVNNQIEGIIFVYNDISHIMEVDRMKSDFISIASHQLRTPLSKMKWMTEMLIDDKTLKLTKDQKQLVDDLYHANEQLIDLVTALLNISRFESGRIVVNPELTDLPKLAKQVLKNLDYLISKKDLQLQLEIEETVPEINIDAKLIGEVYKNLLTNAIKYSHQKERVILKIYKTDQEIITEITDTGLGIPESAKPHIFTRFYRADNVKIHETDGSGLGLYLVRVILQASGGRVWFESKENKGTTFWFALPLTGSKPKTGSVSIEPGSSI